MKYVNSKQWYQLLRPHQYIKNIFIVFPIFFSLQLNNLDLLMDVMIALIAFSIASSAVYIINDILDRESDQKHPEKKHRPLASGSIEINQAIRVMLLLLLTAIWIMGYLSTTALSLMLLYIGLNIFYSFHLKHIAIIDINIIAIGFVIRLFVGAVVSNTPLSVWIVTMTFLLALFLALAKRRDDILIFLDTGKKMRKVVDGYNLPFIDGAMFILSSVVIVAYILYTTSSNVALKFGTDYLYITAFFVILGILRYLQITFVEQNSGNPTKVLLHDRFLQLTIIAWMGCFFWILYL